MRRENEAGHGRNSAEKRDPFVARRREPDISGRQVAGRKFKAAQAALENVTGRGVPAEQFADAAISLIEAITVGNPTDLPERLAGMVERVQTGGLNAAQVDDLKRPKGTLLSLMPVRHLENAHYVPLDDFPGPVSHAGYLSGMLSRQRREDVTEALERDLALTIEAHEEALLYLRGLSPQIYTVLMRARCGTAMKLALATGTPSIETVEAIRVHTVFLSAATGNALVAWLRSLAKNPLGAGFAGRNEWLNMAGCCSAAIVDPAKIIVKIRDLPITADMSDEEAIKAAVEAGILPCGEASEKVVEMAKNVRERLPGCFKRGHPNRDLELVLAFIGDKAGPVANFKAADFKEAQWTKRSFSEDRIGATSAEGTVLVAMNLLAAKARIDVCIEALTNGRAVPTFAVDPSPDIFSNKALYRVTDALRVEGQPDRHSVRELGDPDNQNSGKLCRKVRGKLADGSFDTALAALQIDPGVWFRR